MLQRGQGFPTVQVDQVLGLIKVLRYMGDRADAMHINEAIDVDAGELSHVIDAAEALGLIKFSGGDLELTELGRRLAEAGPVEARSILREALAKVEPFSTIIKRLGGRGEVDPVELREAFEAMGYETNEAKVLAHWVIFTSLLGGGD